MYKPAKILLIVLPLFSWSLAGFCEEGARSPEKMFYEALELHKQGKYRVAADKMEEVYRIDPVNPNVVYNLAKFSGDSGQDAKAVKYYNKLMKLEPNNVDAEAGAVLYQARIYAREHRYAEGADLLLNVVEKVPNNMAILWNTALLSSLSEQHKKALKYWKRLAKHEPDNMLAQSKIVQTHQALNDLDNRDKAIKMIYSMYERNADPDYISKNRFCREQYPVGYWRVYVFQYFEPGDKDRYFYRYSVTDKTGHEQFWLSLGSYQSTTEIARQTGSISDSERVYHLDYYDAGLHSLQAMYNAKPGFDELRSVTKQIITEKMEEYESTEKNNIR